MSRARVEIVLVVAGLLLAAVQAATLGSKVPKVAPGSGASTEASTPAPRASAGPADVLVIWRDFRPGERTAGSSPTSVRLCGAALERGTAKSALVLRFCNGQPVTPQRRFALGYDDLQIRADLPGGSTLAYDLLDFTTTQYGGRDFSEHPLPANDVTVTWIGVRRSTDIVVVLARPIPFGLPTVEISGRLAGAQFHELHRFVALDADVRRGEAQRVRLAPDWTVAIY